jgi:Rrf2 family protein
MDLPQTTEYALRALSHIATLEGDASASAESIARATNVPPHYLSKVLRRLVSAGLLDARKGPGGGFSLAKPAQRIRLIEVLEATDSTPHESCAFGWGKCDGRNPCPLHGTWSELKEAIHSWASKTTLADVRAYAVARAAPARPLQVAFAKSPAARLSARSRRRPR